MAKRPTVRDMEQLKKESFIIENLLIETRKRLAAAEAQRDTLSRLVDKLLEQRSICVSGKGATVNVLNSDGSKVIDMSNGSSGGVTIQ